MNIDSSNNNNNSNNNVSGNVNNKDDMNFLSDININIFSPNKKMRLMHINSNESSNNKGEKSLSQRQFDRNLMTPGQTISREGEFLRGHGTFHSNNALLASVCGLVERVDKLVSVRPFKARYHGEIGDIVVGRITQVGSKRWKVDVAARQDYILMLTAINLPGGIQRRRTSSDELQMRNFFVENDLVYAEVQAINQDGSVALHTRNQRYGKLQNGTFMSVPPSLIKRGKIHYHSLESIGVDIILGVNGYIWLADSAQQRQQASLIQQHEKENYDQPLLIPQAIREVSRESRIKIARVKNSIEVLNRSFMLIHPRAIMEIYQLAEKMSLPLKDMLHPDKIKQMITAVHTNLTSNKLNNKNKTNNNNNNQDSEGEDDEDDLNEYNAYYNDQMNTE
ncbi:Exosome complex exonuclease [Heterostelium album PN500]|uniref:Exosome complex exonuclease n=1 Tax=Heterostelium pallidum (strain ATCC 26659 / Pp 5 / PN500) TaxID=670386 RepID=D3BDG0_HETP5|nr:Exosome complex exonuclease [Heterostelium album PN500]EFA80604.1 Exosome complex exonuclease [Heterostelium album PN500]|eukprot:XP_020432724.1 Exosome complex exonuclease [Heterostelium album PN500]